MDTIPEYLVKEFAEIVKRGNEQEARDFLIKNIKSFPQQLQDEIITAFFEEALIAKNNDTQAIASFRKQSFDMIRELEQAQQKLEDKKKLIEIKDSI